MSDPVSTLDSEICRVHSAADIDAAALPKAPLVVVPNEHMAQRCIALGARPEVVVTIPPAVNRSEYRPDTACAPASAGSPRLLSVCEDTPAANLDRLLQACANVLARHPGLRVVHIGRSTRDWARYPFAEHHEEAELPAWMRWPDALVAVDLEPDSELMVARALATGVPCIVSRREPLSDVVTHGWDGLHVDPQDSGEIATAIKQMADPSVQARLAAPARTASERFDAARIAQREAGVYRAMHRTDWPLLSVVLPTYNRASLIEKAVRNVLEQDYPSVELIVVNDGSTDGTATVLARMQSELNDPRLRVVSRANGGLPVALNSGFAQARGEYWTWTSDDNAYHPGALRALARELELETEAGLVYADMRVTDEHGKQRLFQCGPPANVEDKSTIGGCFLYRAAVAKAVGDYDPEVRLAEDYDYWLRMRKHTRFIWLPRVLYDYRDAPLSLTRTRFHAMQTARLRVIQREFGERADWADRRFEHLVRFSALAKNYGLTGSSLRTAAGAVAQRPVSWIAWKSLLRALTPGPLLRLTRRTRGLDAS